MGSSCYTYRATFTARRRLVSRASGEKPPMSWLRRRLAVRVDVGGRRACRGSLGLSVCGRGRNRWIIAAAGGKHERTGNERRTGQYRATCKDWVAGGRSVGTSLEEKIHWPCPCGRVCTNKRSWVKRRSTVNATIEGEARDKRASGSRMDAISTPHRMTAKGGRMGEKEKRYRRRYQDSTSSICNGPSQGWTLTVVGSVGKFGKCRRVTPICREGFSYSNETFQSDSLAKS